MVNSLLGVITAITNWALTLTIFSGLEDTQMMKKNINLRRKKSKRERNLNPKTPTKKEPRSKMIKTKRIQTSLSLLVFPTRSTLIQITS